MMGIDIDDQHVVELALMRLLAGMGEQPRRVQFLDGDAPAAIGHQFHGVLLKCILILSERRGATAGQRPVQLCHMPSSNTARLADFNRPLAVTMTSVEVTRLRSRERREAVAGFDLRRIAAANRRHQRLQRILAQKVGIARGRARASMSAASLRAIAEASPLGAGAGAGG